jgi:transposase-like protein
MSERIEKDSEKSPEVSEKATRRRFTTAYKQQILCEADQCTEPGELGRLLRREGLYSSSLTRWRRERDAGALEPKQRGRIPNPNKKEAQELARLKRENQRLTEQLRQAKLIIEVQKKVSQMMGIVVPREKSD